MKLGRFATLSSLLVCFSTAMPASAGTLVVDNDFLDCPQADFNSISAAVAAAQPGDKILVCPGVYRESVEVNKNDLRIEGKAAPGQVVLEGPIGEEVGFRLLNTTRVLVEGFTVSKFRIGIVIEGGSANILRKNVTTASPIVGIEVLKSTANVVEHNISFGNTGIQFPGGIFVSTESTRNIVRHNEAFQNDSGIGALRSGPDNLFFGNRSYGNRRFGITNSVGSHGNVLENNHVFENALGGITIGASNDVTARNNRTENNTAHGIRLQNGSTRNLVEKNEIFRNTEDGILLVNNVDENVFQLNHIRQSGRDGIRVDAASNGNTIGQNVIRESGEHDAHDDSTANVWINNKCETENRPGLCKNPF
jgi:parallel beta-helix repeat protein